MVLKNGTHKGMKLVLQERVVDMNGTKDGDVHDMSKQNYRVC